jgi:hypothetical protein
MVVNTYREKGIFGALYNLITDIFAPAEPAVHDIERQKSPYFCRLLPCRDNTLPNPCPAPA